MTGDLQAVLDRVAAPAVQGVIPAAGAGLVVGSPAEPELLASTRAGQAT